MLLLGGRVGLDQVEGYVWSLGRFRVTEPLKQLEVVMGVRVWVWVATVESESKRFKHSLRARSHHPPPSVPPSPPAFKTKRRLSSLKLRGWECPPIPREIPPHPMSSSPRPVRSRSIFRQPTFRSERISRFGSPHPARNSLKLRRWVPAAPRRQCSRWFQPELGLFRPTRSSRRRNGRGIGEGKWRDARALPFVWFFWERPFWPCFREPCRGPSARSPTRFNWSPGRAQTPPP